MTERLVLCGGARRSSREAALRLALDGRARNVTLRIEDISRRLLKDVPDLLIDLLEIATYIFCADQATKRGGEAQIGMGSAWRRHFRFIIPVRRPKHWSDATVLDALCETLSFLSEDDYAFEFERAIVPPAIDTYFPLGGPDDASFNADAIVLFSGGLDSLSGAIEELSASGRRVALVSHRSSSKVFDYQKQLVAELRRRFPRRLMHFPVLATRQEALPVREYTQRSRSFLYMALGTVVARLFGNRPIRFFENGVVSINLPISEQLIGARATRTTHPLVLERFRDFFSVALESPIDVANPFIWKTKEEVIRAMVDRGCGALIKNTVSCTRTYHMTKVHSHCGCCSQCLDRRFGILAAKAERHEAVRMYKVELLSGAREAGKDQTMAESYVRTALQFRNMAELPFFGRFSGETARVSAGLTSLSADEVGRRVLELHQRHGQAIGKVLEAAVKQHSAELIAGGLPPSSVIMMAITRGTAPRLSTPKVIDSWPAWIEQVEKETEATADEAASGQKAGRKSHPALALALNVLDELYPEGIPDQSTEPNATLCRRVGDKLKKAGLRDVSNDTILRAAGRRRK